jgi:hypothetical protein
MEKPNLFHRFIKWWKVYYWNVVNDLPRDRKRTKRGMLRWVFLYPWYKFLGMLNRAGFMNTPEATYMSIFHFTPFFWRTLIDRSRRQEQAYWKAQIERERQNSLQLREEQRRHWQHEIDLLRQNYINLLEDARRSGSEEVWEYLKNRIGG